MLPKDVVSALFKELLVGDRISLVKKKAPFTPEETT
jgi:hypothetical protein